MHLSQPMTSPHSTHEALARRVQPEHRIVHAVLYKAFGSEHCSAYHRT
jgi:hypothetical protein